MELRIVCGILLSCILGAFCQSRPDRPPVLGEGLSVIYVREDTPVGGWVARVLAFDPERQPITFGITEDLYDIGKDSGNITVKRKLDFEESPETFVNITGSDGVFRVYRTVLMKINDTNDEVPEFTREFYGITLSEDTRIGATVLSGISVTDRDAAGTNSGDIRVTCNRMAAENAMDPCDYVQIQRQSSTGRSWQGNLVLVKQLDFERFPTFTVPLQAFDGVNRRDTGVEVTVEDVDDAPPVFVGSLTASIPENVPVSTSVMTFSATDGDGGPGDKIQYELVSNPGGYFALDRTTGRLTTARTLDREVLFNRLITIQVAALEAGAGDGGDPSSRTLAQAMITVEDENDNSPMFVVISPAILTIKEDIPDRTPLPTSLTVTDKDEGTNAQFVLRLLTYNDTFDLFPTAGRGTLGANIRVKDTSKIDYEKGPKQYILQLEAKEGMTTEQRGVTAFLTVNIEDVNDNAPTFDRTSYSAQVSELATGGTVVTTITATDLDSGIYGMQGLRYKLVGNGADLFQVNRLTGEITVRPCATPGSGNCLDAERQPSYTLSFLVRDNYAEGFQTQVPVTIRVLDENDNSPIFSLGNYESFIEEGDVSPNPRVTVQATDADSNRNGNNVITYSIIGGNPTGLWQIGLTSGVVTATRPVDFASTPGGSGVYTLTVQAADPKYKTTGTVRINVKDKNNFTPEFIPTSYYEEYIPEDSPPGSFVLKVQAIDNDASNSPNGQVSYRISSGSQDQFVINADDGTITVNNGALFDFDKQKRYDMTVVVADKGTPSRSATGTVVVFIRDANNKKPYFEPSSVRVDIYENATVNTRVTQMKALDPDSNAVLIYSFVQPFTAWGPNGRQVNINTYNYSDLFVIDPNTGIVRTKRLLDRDKAAVVSTTVRVRDTTGSPDQTALATLIMNILEVNDRPPQFPFPWTPTNRYLNISVQEELPVSYSVATIQATDPHDAVVDYNIISDPGGFFNINPVTGVLTIRRVMDYEQIQSTFFVVTAADNGRPPLTSTATVNVNVININDNTPNFIQTEFNIDLEENAPGGSTVAVVTATDLDLGDFGIVRYSLKDPLNRFVIDPITGAITVRDGAELDRETVSVITLSVEAYDSPNNPNDRKSTNIPVYITLEDTNDHSPTFDESVYRTSISENVPVQYSVIQVSASDGDSGQNAKLTYFIISGNPQGLFSISPTTGLITTAQALEGRPGQYNITVGVRDHGTPGLVGRALVIVDVIQANNKPPVFIWPVFDNQTITVLENQYLGMVITNKVKAKDDGEGENGVITYGFYYNNQFVAETPNFRINPITGIITARAVYDREAKDEYVVQLVARDGGNPPFETTRYVIIKVLDTDDHDPMFPNYRNCCVIPVNFGVQENMPRLQLVGQVNATDLDIGQNAETRYTIIGGNNDKAFIINATSGVIYTNRSLDHEIKSKYMLTIRASNIRTKNRPNLNPLCACLDQSVILVYVSVRNRNDFPPIFDSRLYNACISYDAQISKSVTTIRARDPDSTIPTAVLYSLNQIMLRVPRVPDTSPATGVFTIGNTTGVVSSAMLMALYRDKYFSMRVVARDHGDFSSNATLRIFVTDPAQEVLITVKEDIDQVMQGRLEEVVEWVSEVTGGIVCVNDVRVHMGGDRNIDVTMTDILLHVVDGSKYYVWDATRVLELLWGDGGLGPVTGALGIEKVEAANSFWGGFVIDPLLIAVILTLLLLLLLLFLLCCICCCMKAKKRAVRSGFMIQPSGQINPLWKEKLYEDQELNMKLDTVDRGGNIVVGEEATARLALGGAGGATTTRTETTMQEYSMNYEHTTMQQQIVNGGTQISFGEPQITAALEGGHQQQARSAAITMLNGAGNNAHSNMNAAVMEDSATQVELMASRASLRDADSGPTAIGARLHSYDLDGTQEVHSNDFYSSMSRLREDEYMTSPSWQKGTLSGAAVGGSGMVHHDSIHLEESHGYDNPDGFYQGEIILGSAHLPQFPNQQRAETRYRTESTQYLYDGNSYH